MKLRRPIIGQEAICPDGLGRVVDYNLGPRQNWIKVETYINNRGYKWDADDVELLDPRNEIMRGW